MKEKRQPTREELPPSRRRRLPDGPLMLVTKHLDLKPRYRFRPSAGLPYIPQPCHAARGCLNGPPFGPGTDTLWLLFDVEPETCMKCPYRRNTENVPTLICHDRP